MRTIKLAAILTIALGATSVPMAARLVPAAVGPSFSSIGPLAFGPNGVLFAADRQAATIFALDLGAQASSGTTGTASVPKLDEKIAAVLGAAPADITITDLAVHPTSHNSFVSVVRGQGAAAQSALLRVDGAGKIDVIALENVQFTNVALPNPAAVNPQGRGGRTQSVTDMAFVDGHLMVAGLSNEEFASKLWSVAYPFAKADQGASVEIYHGNHGQFETRAPVMTFLPYKVGAQSAIVAAYTCTPLVKFSIDTLKPGQKIVGQTMMDLGAGNQPIDMIPYAKDGQSFILIANTRHGIIKVPTAQFATAPSITAKVDTAGSFQPVPSMAGVEQLDLLDAQHAVSIARGQDGARSLTTTVLP